METQTILNILFFIFYLAIIYIIFIQVADIFSSVVIIVAITVFLYMIKYTYNIMNIHILNKETFDASQCTAGQRGLVYGALIPNNLEPTKTPNKLTVYAGDIIDLSLSLSNKKFSLDTSQNKLFLSNQLDYNLKKLRIVLGDPNTKPTPYQLYPIRYGDPIKLKFTIGRITDYYVSLNNDNLIPDCHQGTIFQILNADDIENKNAITTLDNIILKINDENKYISIDENNILIIINDIKNATKFNLILTNQCSPNWRFDYNNKLIDRKEANKILELYTKDINQQIADVEKNKITAQKTCATKLATIINERNTILSKINELKK